MLEILRSLLLGSLVLSYLVFAFPVLLKKVSHRSPRFLITCWITLLALIGVLSLVCFLLCCYSVYLSYTSYQGRSLTWETVWPTLAISFSPWILISILGISVAVTSERMTPGAQLAKQIDQGLAQVSIPTFYFKDIPVVVLTTDVILAFCKSIDGVSFIYLSEKLITELTERQLQTVLVHEYTHIVRNHLRLIRIAKALTNIFPWVRNSHVALDVLTGILEREADDASQATVSPDELQIVKSKIGSCIS